MEMSIWDDLYESNDLFIPDKPPPSSQVIANIAGEYMDIPNSKVLDVGCGTCVVSIAFKSRGAHVTGLDANKKAVSIASTIIDKAYTANAFNIPEDDNSFDLVISSGLIEHYQDKEIIALLKEQQRVSKNYVYALVPNPHDLFYRLYKASNETTWEFADERNIDVSRYAPDAGLQVVRIDATNLQHSFKLAGLPPVHTNLENIGYLCATLMRSSKGLKN